MTGFDIFDSAKTLLAWGETGVSPFLISAFVLLDEVIVLRFLNLEDLDGGVFELFAVDVIKGVDEGDYFFIILVSLLDGVAMASLDALAALE